MNDSIIKWMRDLYFNQIDTNKIDGSKSFKNYINEAVSFPLSRQIGFINLKYQLGMYTSGYVYTTFSCSMKNNKVIYAVVYYRDNKPKFISLSPSYESSKGEFRDSFIEYESLVNVYKKYGKIMEPIEELLLKAFKDEDIDINYNFYPHSKEVEIDISMFGIRLMTASAYLLIYRKRYGQIQQHIHKVYMNIISSIIETDNITLGSKEIYNELFNSGFNRPYGQKINPLSVGEAIHINDISYPTWRELFISYATSDMVLNSICPSFPVSANWTYIEGVNQHTFDNIIIKDKYIQNNDVKDTLSNLKEIYNNTEDMYYMEESRERIYDSIQYITSYKLLSNIAISRIDEFAGLTLTSIVPTIRKAEVVPPHYHQIVTDIRYFDKFMFDLMYATHVLHKRIGVIHFDLHLNNMTIMKVDDSFYKLEDGKYKYNMDKKYGTAFILDQQQETYIFPFDGYYGTIIDFSDSLVNKEFDNYTSKFITHINFDDIIDNEKEVIFTKLSKSLTYVKRHKDKFKGAIVSRYEDMFKAITAIDYVSITRNLKILFEKEMGKPKSLGDVREFTVSDKIMSRLEFMEETSMKYLLESIQNVVDDEGKDVNYVGDVLLKKFFKSYLYDQQQDKKPELYEVYKYDSDWKYNVASYETFPIWAKKDKVEQKLGKEVAKSVFEDKSIPIDTYRDVHLNFLIESLSSKYDLDVEQKSSLLD